MNLKYKFHCWKRHKKLAKEIKKPDWDYGYIYSLIAAKLENVLDYAIKDSVTYPEHWKLDKLKICIKLAKHLAGITENYPEHINKNNIARFVHPTELKFFNFNHEERPFEKWNTDVLNFVTGKLLDEANYHALYDVKAQHLFFKMLNQYINCWWD